MAGTQTNIIVGDCVAYVKTPLSLDIKRQETLVAPMGQLYPSLNFSFAEKEGREQARNATVALLKFLQFKQIRYSKKKNNNMMQRKKKCEQALSPFSGRGPSTMLFATTIGQFIISFVAVWVLLGWWVPPDEYRF